MHFFGILCAALALLLVCSFFPGFFFVRRLRWTPLEKLCGSVGLSLIFVYLGAWGAYTLGPKDQRPVYWAIAGASVVLGVLCVRDSVRFFRSFRIRQVLLSFAFLLAWTFTMLSIIRVYSGAMWGLDWAEHFQRALFFLDRFPTNTVIVELYALPARPPMQNVIAAFFLGLTADRFEVFQLIFGFLNTLLFLPCLLLMPAFGLRKRRAVIALVVLFAANPAVMEQITYTWTKTLPAFYVVLATALYLAGWRKNDATRTVAAFLALGAGILAHYSTGPYVVVIGLHYLWRVFRSKPIPWRELTMAIVPAALLLATWFGWSFKEYGPKVTLASNTSVTSSEKDTGKNVLKMAANTVDTIIPGWMRDNWPDWKQANSDGQLRDQAFAFYQVNLIFAMGSLGGPLVLWLLFRHLVRGDATKERVFWRVLVPACVVLGVAVVGERDSLGVAHLTLLALVVMGLTALASSFPRMNTVVRLAIVAACCVDFGLGVFLQARMESLENTTRETVYGDLVYAGFGRFQKATPTPRTLSDAAAGNWMLKHKTEAFTRWLNDLPQKHSGDLLFRANFRGLESELRGSLETNQKGWGGWYERHGGKLEYLGDHVAGPSGSGTDIASGVFLLMFAGCIYLLGRQALAKAPVEAKTPVMVAKRSAARKSARR